MRRIDGILKIEEKENPSKIKTNGVKDEAKRKFLKTLGVLGVGALVYSLFPSKAQALIFGSTMRAPDPIGLKNASGSLINPATEEGNFPSGSATDGQVDLTLADTWYPVPASAPIKEYTIICSLETSAGTVRFSFDNNGSPSTTNGNKAPTNLAVKMGANKTLYFGSTAAGDDVNYTIIEKN